MNIEQRTTIARAAEAWAAAKGYAGGLKQVAFEDANEMIAAVAGATHVDARAVRDALLAQASAAREGVAAGAKQLGTQSDYQASGEHRPIAGHGRRAPAAVQIQAQIATKTGDTGGLIDQLADMDRLFRQTMQDLGRARIAVTDRASPRVLNEVHLAGLTLLARLQEHKDSPNNAQVREEIVTVYQDLLSRLARERGVFLVKDKTPQAALTAVGPDAPAVSLLAARTKKAEKHTQPLLDPDLPRTLGAAATLAVDPSTGRTFVFDFQGEVKNVLSIEDFVRARQKHIDAQADKVRHHLPKAPEQLRALSDATLEKLSKKVTYVSLIDGDRDPLARVYPTVWFKPRGSIVRRRVICDGPLKGIFLDDLVNRVAQKSGQGFRFDPRSRKAEEIVPREGEAFVSTAKIKERGEIVQKLFVTIPYEREWTEIRRALRRMSELDPSIKYQRDSQNTSFYFSPENYGVVREVLRTLVLDKPALTMLETYFGKLHALEASIADEKLEAHSMAAIGGYRTHLLDADGRARKTEHTYWQKKGLAWLAARDYRGVIALGTGMGKTLLAIGAIQELRKQGVKGTFLLVVPPALRGNFQKEIHRFLEPDEAKAVLARLQVLSYPQFAKASRTGEHEGQPFAPEKAAAIIFDEAQWLKSAGTTRTRAALAIDHPHKICLTASPMEQSPMEAYVLACVANNVNLLDRVEGKQHRYRMRKFKDLYCETLGGRILGVKQKVELMPGLFIDPKHNLDTWVRQNLFYADKTFDDKKLPELTLQTDVMMMPAKMEAAHRKAAVRIAKVLRGMVSMYRDKGIEREYIDDKGRTRKEISPLARNKRIGQMFGVRLRGVIAKINDVGNNPEKIKRAADILWKHLDADPKARAVLFSDSPTYVLQTAQELSRQVPGKLHAACLANEIRLFRDGKEVTEHAGHTLPFNARAYQGATRAYGAEEWQQFVLNEVLGQNKDVVTTTMLGPVYQQGQNLQWANVGFHLDRDTWNRENTKQREARLWRQGQAKPVTFHNLDWVYRKPKDRYDHTLDEIRGYVEQIGGALFRDVIETPLQNATLGEEWQPVREEDDLLLDLSQLELGLVPTLARAANPEER